MYEPWKGQIWSMLRIYEGGESLGNIKIRIRLIRAIMYIRYIYGRELSSMLEIWLVHLSERRLGRPELKSGLKTIQSGVNTTEKSKIQNQTTKQNYPNLITYYSPASHKGCQVRFLGKRLSSKIVRSICRIKACWGRHQHPAIITCLLTSSSIYIYIYILILSRLI